MNEEVMYWISPASNRPIIAGGLKQWMKAQADTGYGGGLWMLHMYWKQLRYEGGTGSAADDMRAVFVPHLLNELIQQVGQNQSQPGKEDRILYEILGFIFNYVVRFAEFSNKCSKYGLI